jgi:metal-responsive CopG/Arc/MetJ family transcriptional regulator
MEKRSKIKYTTVHIPTVLAKTIDKVIENGELAYASRSEFIKDAIRRFLEYYGYHPRNKGNVKNDALYAGLSPDVIRLLTQTKKDSEKSQ